MSLKPHAWPAEGLAQRTWRLLSGQRPSQCSTECWAQDGPPLLSRKVPWGSLSRADAWRSHQPTMRCHRSRREAWTQFSVQDASLAQNLLVFTSHGRGLDQLLRAVLLSREAANWAQHSVECWAILWSPWREQWYSMCALNSDDATQQQAVWPGASGLTSLCLFPHL